MRDPKPAVAVLAAALLAAAPAAAQRVSLGTGDVAVYDLAGTVRAVAAAGGETVAEVVREGADAARLQVQAGALDGRQTLRVVFPGDRVRVSGGSRWSARVRVRDDGTFGDGHGGGGFFSGREVTLSGEDGLDARATITLAVPAGRTLAIYVGAGLATVTNVDGRITVHSVAADVTTSGTRGTLTLDTGSGTTSVTDAHGTLDVDSGSGGVSVRGLTGETLAVDAGSGRFRAEGVDVAEARLDLGSGGAELAGIKAPSLTVDAGSGTVNIDLRGEVRVLKVDSGSGPVTLRLPRATSAQLDIDAGSGGYRLELPMTMTRRSRSRMSGSIGDGRGRISIDSGSGEVRLLAGA